MPKPFLRRGAATPDARNRKGFATLEADVKGIINYSRGPTRDWRFVTFSKSKRRTAVWEGTHAARPAKASGGTRARSGSGTRERRRETAAGCRPGRGPILGRPSAG